jgi:opine dehydrogenase
MEGVAVIGAGNGGCAAAADLVRRGYKVNLFSRSEGTLRPIHERGGVEYTGSLGEGFSPVENVTTDMRKAIEGTDVIVITTPTTAHGWCARLLAPLLRPEHIVLLNPGHTGGGLHFVHSLRESGFSGDVRTCETITLAYGCRMAGPAKVRVMAVMTNLRLAAFPSRHLHQVLPKIKELFPNVIPAGNVLDTGLLNLNAMEHPPGMLLNAGWIEFTKGNFRFYSEGITPAVARVIQRIDEERLAVVRTLNRRARLGMKEMSFIEYFHEAGFTSLRAVEANDMYMALQDSEPNKPVKAPDSLRHRYVDEDVGFGLVPIYYLGQMAGVTMPVTRLMIDLACVERGVDFWTEGLTLEKMGLQNVDVGTLAEYLEHGSLARAHA